MFKNVSVPILSIPRVGEEGFNLLEPKYREVKLILALLYSILLASTFLALYFFAFILKDWSFWILLIPFLLFVFLAFYIAYFGFSQKMYQLREKDIIFRNGLWWKSETSVPFVRVQHSEVIQGPIERFFGLSRLKLFTAGGYTSDLSIPGLNPSMAEDLKDYITKSIQYRKSEEE